MGRRFLIVVACAMGVAALATRAGAQPADSAQIDWEVANRFRLFATQADFDHHLTAFRDSGGTSVLAAEQKMEAGLDGNGWASGLRRLCYDAWRGRIVDRCNRDGVVENYLNPTDARIRLTVRLPGDFGDATCDWRIGAGGDAKTRTANCREPIDNERAGTIKPTTVSVIAKTASGRTAQGSVIIQVRDILIVGMGDSIASGEGNPMKPVALSNQGFCFRRALKGFSKSFYLPGRASAAVVDDCPQTPADIQNDRDIWDAAAAGWLYNQCHRSLYSYQARTALTLAMQNRQISVTFLPLGCTGATIAEGLLDSQEARERPIRRGRRPGPVVEGQLSQLKNYLLVTGQRGPFRRIDLILLTIGANDIGFSGLVANIIVKENPERALAIKTGVIVTPDDARNDMKDDLRDDFRTLRRELLALTGGDLKKVLFATYGNPATFDGGKSCSSTRTGFDSHPAFAVDGDILSDTVKFVNTEFLPTLKGYVTCAANAGCTGSTQAMTYVDGHSNAFADHGFCATSDGDPAFDKACFHNGDSFKGVAEGLTDPLTCTQRPSAFKPYATRARWVRTANDSYFAAMTYPTREGLMSSPSNIHDALWGVESVVYGGAIHPTAEGHAAMADAALSTARELLGLASP